MTLAKQTGFSTQFAAKVDQCHVDMRDWLAIVGRMADAAYVVAIRDSNASHFRVVIRDSIPIFAGQCYTEPAIWLIRENSTVRLRPLHCRNIKQIERPIS